MVYWHWRYLAIIVLLIIGCPVFPLPTDAPPEVEDSFEVWGMERIEVEHDTYVPLPEPLPECKLSPTPTFTGNLAIINFNFWYEACVSDEEWQVQFTVFMPDINGDPACGTVFYGLPVRDLKDTNHRYASEFQWMPIHTRECDFPLYVTPVRYWALTPQAVLISDDLIKWEPWTRTVRYQSRMNQTYYVRSW